MPDSYASIFGVEAPQFEKSSTVVELDYVQVIKDEPDLDDILHQSVKTGHKEWTRRGKHWVFEVIVNLTKYGSNAYDKYQELKSYKYSLVDKLWKRRDGTQVQNDDDEDVKFFIEEIKEFYFDHYLYPDRLKMRFVSQDPVDLPISGGSVLPTWSPEMQIYFNQLDLLPDLDVLIKIAEFIDGLVADGVYSKIDEMWMLAMNNSFNATRGIKGVKNCGEIGTPTFTAYRGYQGDTGNTKALSTNFIPSVDGVNFTLNTNSIGVYSRTSQALSRVDIGGQNAASKVTGLMSGNTTISNARVASNQNGYGVSLGGGTDTLGLLVMTRTSSSNIRLYKFGSFANQSSSVSSMTDRAIYICANNNNGTISSSSGKEYSFAFVGGYLTDTDIQNLATRLETYLDYVGAGVI